MKFLYYIIYVISPKLSIPHMAPVALSIVEAGSLRAEII